MRNVMAKVDGVTKNRWTLNVNIVYYRSDIHAGVKKCSTWLHLDGSVLEWMPRKQSFVSYHASTADTSRCSRGCQLNSQLKLANVHHHVSFALWASTISCSSTVLFYFAVAALYFTSWPFFLEVRTRWPPLITLFNSCSLFFLFTSNFIPLFGYCKLIHASFIQKYDIELVTRIVENPRAQWLRNSSRHHKKNNLHNILKALWNWCVLVKNYWIILVFITEFAHLFLQVLSGDSVIIRGQPKGGPPPERQLNLSGINAPRLGRRATNKYAFHPLNMCVDSFSNHLFVVLRKQKMRLMLGKLENSFARSWLAKKLYSLLNTRFHHQAESMVSYTLAKVRTRQTAVA